MANKPELNMEVMQKLYEFGGLAVYRVSYFDPVIFKIVTRKPTFNEDAAKEELNQLSKAGFPASLETFMVNFDGAFAIRPPATAPY